MPPLPTPYFDRDGITLINGDCLDILPSLEHVDHIITDPPYAARAMKNARSGSTIKQRRDGVEYDFGYCALSDELRRAAAMEFGRLCRRWTLVWSDLETAHQWRACLESAALRYVRMGVWVRQHAAPQFSGDRPAQGAEACVIAHGGDVRLRWNGGGRPAAWVGPIVNAAASHRQHASPKPLWLMRTLIEQFTDPGDLILDPFAGSGTTLRAAKDLGRRAIGIEISEVYCAVAVERLRQEAMAL